ncbi:MAG: HEPN domain-containing protein [Burkholderiales bacterium]|nr:MAG: HEPN domain-containing protein [Burkholderiales bacterium]
MEEKDLPSIKSHDLIRLQQYASITLSSEESDMLAVINEVYIDARYPGDLGLLPQGKPTPSEVQVFIKLCEAILQKVRQQILGN